MINNMKNKENEKQVIDAAVLVVKLNNGKIYQVALTNEMSDVLLSDLKNYFDGGAIQLLPNELEGILIQ